MTQDEEKELLMTLLLYQWPELQLKMAKLSVDYCTNGVSIISNNNLTNLEQLMLVLKAFLKEE